MATQCNIDGRGRLARLITGLLTLAGAVAAIVLWAWPGGGAVAWIVSALLVLAGLFQVYEAAVGWCATRALGFRTPM